MRSIKLAKILVMAGSLRAGAYSKQLARCVAAALGEAEAEVDLVELNEFEIPVYDGDLEDAAFPPGVEAFKARLRAAQGFVFCSPEYNHSVPGAFKNALDWASRGEGEDPFEGKWAALMGSSPGALGGARMLPHLRQVTTALGLWLLPGQVTVSKAHEAFDEAGQLKSEFYRSQVAALCRTLVTEVDRRG